MNDGLCKQFVHYFFEVFLLLVNEQTDWDTIYIGHERYVMIKDSEYDSVIEGPSLVTNLLRSPDKKAFKGILNGHILFTYRELRDISIHYSWID